MKNARQDKLHYAGISVLECNIWAGGLDGDGYIIGLEEIEFEGAYIFEHFQFAESITTTTPIQKFINQTVGK